MLKLVCPLTRSPQLKIFCFTVWLGRLNWLCLMGQQTVFLKSFHRIVLERTLNLGNLAGVTAFWCRWFLSSLYQLQEMYLQPTSGPWVTTSLGCVGGWIDGGQMGRLASRFICLAICLRCQVCWHARGRKTCNQSPRKVFAKPHPIAVFLGVIHSTKQYFRST